MRKRDVVILNYSTDETNATKVTRFESYGNTFNRNEEEIDLSKYEYGSKEELVKKLKGDYGLGVMIL